MSRPLTQIIAHIRAVAANPAIRTTLIQTEDLEALCNAAEAANRQTIEAVVTDAIRRFSSPVIGRGVHEGQAGHIVYERDGLPFVVEAVVAALVTHGQQADTEEGK